MTAQTHKNLKIQVLWRPLRFIKGIRVKICPMEKGFRDEVRKHNQLKPMTLDKLYSYLRGLFAKVKRHLSMLE
jgi:hypothetical protein